MPRRGKRNQHHYTEGGKFWDAYRQRAVEPGDPCDVCGDTDTQLVWVEDGQKVLCDEHKDMFGPA